MLVHLAGDGKHAYGISLMRDLWVPIPGYGEAKINSALELGGVPLAVKTVESLLGQKIQHAVMIDFEGFRGITDALGGVEVNNPVEFTADFDTHQHFPAGVIKLQGQRALEFVRERHSFADGDFTRVANQQLFLRSTLAKLLSAGTLTNPVTMYKLVNTASKYITVDKGLNATALASLVYSMRNVRMQDVVSSRFRRRDLEPASTDSRSSWRTRAQRLLWGRRWGRTGWGSTLRPWGSETLRKRGI